MIEYEYESIEELSKISDKFKEYKKLKFKGRVKTYDTLNTTFFFVNSHNDERAKRLIDMYVHNNDYGLDTNGKGLFYSKFDNNTAANMCFSYKFIDGLFQKGNSYERKIYLKFMIWYEYQKEEHNLNCKTSNLQLLFFKQREIKNIEKLFSEIIK